ncbi:hypothetical protein DXZ75_06690 [Streptomyces sp. AcE210]|nr:hypothetical protein DXZ75_06690 [Streptomyces sp. AcE210]
MACTVMCAVQRSKARSRALLMLMAKSRHKKPENVRRYFTPSPEAMAELASLLASGGINCLAAP